ncbi:hypothetical protein [Kitasatospora sp. NPDC056531]|uniref:hypothetical protein n=1 Tax=Kitasatospora sp. NPDC056531 TaxID=3345856 RepID=UPI00368E8B41
MNITATAGRLAGQRDVGRVTAEGADLGAHPAHRRLLVGQSEGSGTRQAAVGEDRWGGCR